MSNFMDKKDNYDMIFIKIIYWFFSKELNINYYIKSTYKIQILYSHFTDNYNIQYLKTFQISQNVLAILQRSILQL
jgi:hypothetical protein